jgi:hypothetical protein
MYTECIHASYSGRRHLPMRHSELTLGKSLDTPWLEQRCAGPSEFAFGAAYQSPLACLASVSTAHGHGWSWSWTWTWLPRAGKGCSWAGWRLCMATDSHPSFVVSFFFYPVAREGRPSEDFFFMRCVSRRKRKSRGANWRLCLRARQLEAGGGDRSGFRPPMPGCRPSVGTCLHLGVSS